MDYHRCCSVTFVAVVFLWEQPSLCWVKPWPVAVVQPSHCWVKPWPVANLCPDSCHLIVVNLLWSPHTIMGYLLGVPHIFVVCLLGMPCSIFCVFVGGATSYSGIGSTAERCRAVVHLLRVWPLLRTGVPGLWWAGWKAPSLSTVEVRVLLADLWG